MNISAPFIKRPVATTLLSVAMALAGGIAFRLLPVAPLPRVEFPTISVGAGLPGADPETMASSVATPLERQFGRIAGLTEMTSTSSLGSTNIVLQFDLNRDIEAAARDVQAAINAARGQLPANLPSNPSYRKVNPADAPIMIVALTSDSLSPGQIYDAATSVLQQKLSQVTGVGQVSVGGGSLPAVRVDVNPLALAAKGVPFEQVRAAIAATNVNKPKGHVWNDQQSWRVDANDQLRRAADYRPIIVAYSAARAPVQLKDVANVQDSVENVLAAGLFNGKPGVPAIIFRQPGANIIETVDRVRAALPQLQAQLPQSIRVEVASDQTTTIRASIHHVEATLVLSVLLVTLVVFFFLRDPRATFIPSVAVPLSLVGTFAVMYLLGYSLDNLSLMALTVATGFVVDDAIVVVENVARHLEDGMAPREAALRGAREIGFTVLTISVSLVAVFLPILLMGGIIGRLFQEFAATLAIAILISLIVSLTTTPMLCAKLLRRRGERPPGRASRTGAGIFGAALGGYARSLKFVLRHRFAVLMITLATVAASVGLYIAAPKGFFPQQDTGRLTGSLVGSQDSSFQATKRRMEAVARIVMADPAVQAMVGFNGGGSATNTGRMFITLKPQSERKDAADQVIARLRKATASIPGGTLYLQAVQDVRVGGRSANAQYQYTLRGDDVQTLNQWVPVMLREVKRIKGIVDVSTDQQDGGLQARVVVDRETAARLGLTPMAIDNALYDAFGQRQVSTIYNTLNQYHVVLEADPKYWRSPVTLSQFSVATPAGAVVPLSAVAHFAPQTTSLSVAHQGQFPAVTISFNLAPGLALGQAVDAINDAARRVGLPATVQSSFQGTAQAFQQSLDNEALLILAALLTVYVVLGVLYESYVHPVTILSTLPSAGIGALLALQMTRTDLSVIALVGILLLIGIVKKNAILMIDFAIEAERGEGLAPTAAIYKACVLRFRPIMMTTMAALLGAVPLAFGGGVGSELRRPLGITIVGGLIASQALTLYTTPVVYLYLERLRLFAVRARGGRVAERAAAPSA